jgi:hypothetical protein
MEDFMSKKLVTTSGNWTVIDSQNNYPYRLKHIPSGEIVNWLSLRYFILYALDYQKLFNWRRKPYKIIGKVLWIHGADRKWWAAKLIAH